MRLALLVPLVAALCIATFAIGLYAGSRQIWPLPQLKRWVAVATDRAVQKDEFGRLLAWPGKTEIACPAQDATTAVLLVAGQSNAANSQGQLHQSPDDRVINFASGRCYRAASPLLGADGVLGETWTLLGMKLIEAGLYRTVILVPAAVGGTPVRRWAAGGDLNAMLVASIRAATARYTITAVLWNQGSEDFTLRTPPDQYRAGTLSVIATVRAEGVRAPFFITRSSIGVGGWTEDNAIARVQASLADSQQGIFAGPDTDRDVTPLDRYDGFHYGATGQQKAADAWVSLLRAHAGP